ncbi:hypothetical protein R75471_01671 [Paraburkholderia domus]|uniref:hypothetical protein n=1 Tax=Paraburkholderia domus TaxID=2793075 RepID=UPI001B06EBDE|nr:hypothetical protein [Paraburkholderia domus]CAE6878976.1 hypothetical protein R75471_01671 [Paraburkholderia domus]
MTASYTRNIQGVPVTLSLIDVDPDNVKLDPTNPRVGFSMRQLDPEQRSDPACTLLLTSQEDTEGLKRSITLSGGVQEPIYLRHDYTVAEGNRRVVATRAAKEEHPEDARFARMPAWLIPEGTPESVIQDLLNEIHLGSVRGWAPYEKALQMRALLASGLIHEEVAERYRMTPMEVRQHIEAADLMDRLYFPITLDPSDAEHRSKFSYFLEFLRSTRLRKQSEVITDLPQRFSRWVRDGHINTGAKVRKLPKVLDRDDALELLEVAGFDAAEELLSRTDPREHELYLTLEKARARLQQITVAELVELAESADRMKILKALRDHVETVIENAEHFGRRRFGSAEGTSSHG